MKKKYSLRSNIEFNKVLNKGKKIRSKYFLISYIPAADFKIGISIPKKLGNAVFRNYNKRIIKNIIPNLYLYDLDYNIVIVIKDQFIDITLNEKIEVLNNELKKIINNG